jgi:hypothetical protein
MGKPVPLFLCIRGREEGHRRRAAIGTIVVAPGSAASNASTRRARNSGQIGTTQEKAREGFASDPGFNVSNGLAGIQPQRTAHRYTCSATLTHLATVGGGMRLCPVVRFLFPLPCFSVTKHPRHASAPSAEIEVISV